MEFKGTKGEWVFKEKEAEYDGNANMWFCVLWKENGSVFSRVYGSTKEEAESNAKLISASKLLLEALQISIGKIPNKFSWLKKRRITEKAIEKALK